MPKALPHQYVSFMAVVSECLGRFTGRVGAAGAPRRAVAVLGRSRRHEPGVTGRFVQKRILGRAGASCRDDTKDGGRADIGEPHQVGADLAASDRGSLSSSVFRAIRSNAPGRSVPREPARRSTGDVTAPGVGIHQADRRCILRCCIMWTRCARDSNALIMRVAASWNMSFAT